MEGPKEVIASMFRGNGRQTHYELISNQGGRHGVPARDAAELIFMALKDAGYRITKEPPIDLVIDIDGDEPIERDAR